MRVLSLSVALLCLPAAAQSPIQFRQQVKRSVAVRTDPVAPAGIAFGDIDGDGAIDLYVANSQSFASSGQDHLWRNDGRGVFADVTGSALVQDLENTPVALLFDADGDGDLDLLQGHEGQKRLLQNDGSGTFTDVTAATLPVDQDFPTSFVSGDVDGDGAADVLLLNHDSLKLYANTGTGAFVDVTAARLPSHAGGRRIRIGDLDGDGDPDLVTCDPSAIPGLRYLVNNGQGVFTDQSAARLLPAVTQAFDFTLLDGDGDGDLDLVTVARGIASDLFYRNNGAGVLSDATTPAFGLLRHERVEAGDVDRDGDVDLVMAESVPGELRLVLNGGNGAFTAAPAGRLAATFRDLMVADFGLFDVDDDGDPDLVLTGAANQRGYPYGPSALERVLYNDGTGTFAAIDSLEIDAIAERVVAYDYDRDLDADLLLLSETRVSLYRNDGARRFVEVTASVLPGVAPAAVAVFGDFDDDGLQDLFLGRDAFVPSLPGQLWFGTAAGGFVNVSSTKLPVYAARTRAVEAGDIDADGDIDLLLGNNPGPNLLLVNDGQGGFTSAPNLGGVSHATLPSYGGVQLVDLDGDGDLDYLNVRQSDLQLFENDGSGQFSLRATLSGLSSSAVRVARAGDFDGNGLADLFVGFHNDYSRAWIAVSPWNFVGSQLPTFGAGIRGTDVEVFDMDGDADLDIAVTGNIGSTLFENTGLGSFVDATAKWFDQRYCGGLAVADLDRDGDLDLVTTGNDTLLWFNRHRQHTAPEPADPGARYRIELACRPGYLASPAVAVLAFSAGAVDVPWPGVGQIGLDPSSMVVLGAFSLPAPGGTADVDLAVANLPSLRGLQWWSQVLFLDGTLRLGGTEADRVR